MRFNPSFLQLFDTIDKANSFEFYDSPENANPERSWLLFCPKEVYNQYILLDEIFLSTIEFKEIIRAELVDTDGNIVNNNLGFGYKKYIESNVLLLSFKIMQDYGDKCLIIKLTFNSGFSTQAGESTYNTLYSNIFSCSEHNREKTSIVTYKHTENVYEIPYRNNIQITPQNRANVNQLDSVQQFTIYNQIRLPLYFLRWKTEQDSSENTYATNTPVNINVSRVVRRDIKVWQVIASDWINQRIDIVSDSDYVYINGKREITRPFEFEETSNGSDFSISKLESQPKYGDEYIDKYGLVNHRPVILAINYPNGTCCVPDGSPIVEPEIINESIEENTCEFQGIHKIITVQGQPNSTVKYRIRASEIQGTTKQIRVYNSDVNNVHNISNTNQSIIGYFYLDGSGVTELNIKCCLEACTPGTIKSINANLELYKSDQSTLSGEICNIQASKNCPQALAPEWVILSENGTNIKDVKISGEPNTTVSFLVQILSEESNPRSFPRNTFDIEGYLDVENTEEGDFWEFTANLNSSGESQNFEIVIEAGAPVYNGTNLESYIYANLTLRDYDGNLSNEVIGVFDRNIRD